MAQTALNEQLSHLEREMSCASDTEKSQALQRLHALINQDQAKQLVTADEGEDLFDNMPI